MSRKIFTAAFVFSSLAAHGEVTVKIEEWEVPTARSRPHDPAAGPDGALWYIGMSANTLGRLEQATGTFREFALDVPNSGPHGLVTGPVWVATLALGLAMLLFDFGGVMFGIQYLSLRQAITPDRLLGRMTATMRFLTVAAAPLGSLAGGIVATAIGLRATLLTIGALGLLLALGAVLRSPVRRHVRLPATADA